MRITSRQLWQLIRATVLLEGDLSGLPTQSQATDDPRVIELGKRIDIFLKNLDALKRNFPNEYKLLSEHPTFMKVESSLRSILVKLRGSQRALQSSVALIEEFNMLVEENNEIIGDMTSLTPEEEKAVTEIAQKIYDGLFPETEVSKFVRSATGQQRLDDYQKWLVAPAEGMEYAISNIYSLTKPETWEEMYRGAETAYNMTSEEWMFALEGIKTLWGKIPADDTARGLLMWLVGSVTLFGGMKQLFSAAGVPFDPRFLKLLYRARHLSKLRALPMAVITGLYMQPL